MQEDIQLKVPEADYKHREENENFYNCSNCGAKIQRSVYAGKEEYICQNCGFEHSCCE